MHSLYLFIVSRNGPEDIAAHGSSAYTMEDTMSLWDPWRVFLHSEHDGRCIGRTNKARDCRNPINSASMQEATKKMIELARIPPRSPDVQSHLLRLASLRLCRRWHQSQSNEIVRRWNEQLSRLFTHVPEPRGLTPPPSPTAHRVVSLASLQQQEFHPTEQLVGRIEMGADATVTISLYQRLPQFPDETCAICRGTLGTDNNYLRCLSCQEGRYHWSCFQSWGRTWSHTHVDAEMSCGIW
jgi:hypothetical protein